MFGASSSPRSYGCRRRLSPLIRRSPDEVLPEYTLLEAPAVGRLHDDVYVFANESRCRRCPRRVDAAASGVRATDGAPRRRLDHDIPRRMADADRIRLARLTVRVGLVEPVLARRLAVPLVGE